MMECAYAYVHTVEPQADEDLKVDLTTGTSLSMRLCNASIALMGS
jgi:hypothetical protein